MFGSVAAADPAAHHGALGIQLQQVGAQALREPAQELLERALKDPALLQALSSAKQQGAGDEPADKAE